MSRLSDIFARVVEELWSPGTKLDIHAAVNALLPLVSEDDKETLFRSEAARRFIQMTTKVKTSALDDDDRPSQIDLFPELRPAHNIDIEGRFIKRTEDLQQIEFARLIDIRSEQIKADAAYLKVLKDAYEEARPVWAKHPAKTFGEVCAILAAARRKTSKGKRA